MPPEEVDELPWWQRRMFIECMNEEFKDPDEAGGEVETTSDLSELGVAVRSIE